MAAEAEKALFGHCVFAFVINKDLPRSQAVEVCYFQANARRRLLTSE
jgi:hypothetical protein